MPWPNFSELTFGYSFLSEFERLYTPGGRFPRAPEFISQRQEAHQAYDVEMALAHGTPVFIQLKRSFVVGRRSAKEGNYFLQFPCFRMYLRKNASYDQHRKLQRHQQRARNALYVTSRVSDRKQLFNAYQRGTVVSSAVRSFRPRDIPLPTDNKQHWVSFERTGRLIRRFSDDPIKIESSISNLEEFIGPLLAEAPGKDRNLKGLRQFVEDVVEDDPYVARLISDVDDPAARASIAAAATMDATLTFVGSLPKASSRALKG